MLRLSELVVEFEGAWPAAHAEDWDRVGLTVGSLDDEIFTVLIAVDLTHEVIDEAVELGVNLILTHHPLLLKPITGLVEETLKGSLISRLIRSSIATFSAHTNADVQADGASMAMAEAFGLKDCSPLIKTNLGFGHGVLGSLPKGISLMEFARVVSVALPATARKVAFSGSPEAQVSRVAICSGAGDSFIDQVLASDADVYVTSDLRHHPALDAVTTKRHGPNLHLIDVSHWAAESLWVSKAMARLNSLNAIKAIASTRKTDPWTQEVN